MRLSFAAALASGAALGGFPSYFFGVSSSSEELAHERCFVDEELVADGRVQSAGQQQQHPVAISAWYLWTFLEIALLLWSLPGLLLRLLNFALRDNAAWRKAALSTGDDKGCAPSASSAAAAAASAAAPASGVGLNSAAPAAGENGGRIDFPLAPVESLDWLNALVAGLWPYLSDAVHRTLLEKVLPSVQAKAPRLGSLLGLESFSLGASTPVLGPIQVFRTAEGLRLAMGFQYASDASICLTAPGIRVGVSAVHVCGDIHIAFEPLLHEFPVVGALSACFLNPPLVTLKFDGDLELANAPGLASLVRDAVDDAIAGAVVMPNRLVVPLGTEQQGVDLTRLRSPRPIGLLRVAAESAAGLPASDLCAFGQRWSDPYVRVRSGCSTWRSRTLKRTCDPRWDVRDQHCFPVFHPGQAVDLDVWDEDRWSADDLLGRATSLSIATALARSGLPLTLGTPQAVDSCGTVRMRFEWLDLLEGERGPDGALLVIEVRALHLPATLLRALRAAEGHHGDKKVQSGVNVAVRAELGGETRSTPMIAVKCASAEKAGTGAAASAAAPFEQTSGGCSASATLAGETDDDGEVSFASTLCLPCDSGLDVGALLSLQLLARGNRPAAALEPLQIPLREVLAAKKLRLPGPVYFRATSTPKDSAAVLATAEISVSLWGLRKSSGPQFIVGQK